MHCGMKWFGSCVLIAVSWTAGDLAAGDTWREFRGPGGQGHSDARHPPVRWSETENVAWKVAVPGHGHSSPVIADGIIWLTTAIETPLSDAEREARLAKIKNSRGLEIVGNLSLRVQAYELKTGKQLRDVELFSVSEPGPIHTLNSYASPTPVLGENHVYCHFGTYGTACVETSTGQVVWKNSSLQVDHQNGPGSSPILYGELLIAHYDGIDQQFVAALNCADGTVAWSVKRSGKMDEKPEFQKAYCTPTLVEAAGRTLLVSPGADWVYAYDPQTGAEIWRAHYGQLGFSTVPRPVFGHGMVYVCTSYLQSRMLAVRYDGKGDISESHVAWVNDSQIPQKPSVLLVDQLIYLVSDGGVATCLDALTGDQVWRARMGGKYSASPLFAGGHIYFFSQEGKVTVLKPGSTYEVVATNELSGGFMASPAVVGDSMILRTDTHLYHIRDSSGVDSAAGG